MADNNSTVHQVVPSTEERFGSISHDGDDGNIPDHESVCSSSSSNESRKSTTSFSKDNAERVEENERRYANETYFMPNDEAEETRLNILHQLYLLILDGRVTKAPIRRDIKRILDVGSGTGDWAMTMAETFHRAQVIATDIDPFDLTALPPNMTFQIDDAEEEWTFTEPFNLIHMRGLMGAFEDWVHIYQEAFKHLKRGALLEVADFDLKPFFDGNSGPYTSMYASALQSAAEEAGRPFNADHLRRATFEAAGFTDIRITKIEVPLGTWPEDSKQKTMGKMWFICFFEGLEAWSLRLLTQQSGWKPEDVRDLCEKVKQELSESTQALTPFIFVLARKPYLANAPS